MGEGGADAEAADLVVLAGDAGTAVVGENRCDEAALVLDIDAVGSKLIP